MSSSYIAGGLSGLDGLGNGAMGSVGDAGNGAVNVLAIYSVVLANKNTYRGVVTFTCKQMNVMGCAGVRTSPKRWLAW
ncbi:hypothetical protein [Duganella sp. CF458]|uniref:hypothetical protein n=1 Tax=Duganella sp. CF458 TaxID=1884368 RepID=UPI0011134DB4|nr:hypothetical protein [Duganella sp. CF458]